MAETGEEQRDRSGQEGDLQQGLKRRDMTMISLGGIIGAVRGDRADPQPGRSGDHPQLPLSAKARMAGRRWPGYSSYWDACSALRGQAFS